MEGEGNSKKVDKEVEKKAIDARSEELIRDALKKFVTEKISKRQTDDEIEAMVSVCSEFMRSFIIMGYDFQGNAIKPVFYAKNDIDADALNQYIQKFIMSSIH